MSNNQPANHTTLATVGRGDVTFPITPTSIDGMTIGQYSASDATINNLTANGASILTGDVSGSGFVSAVNTLISGSGNTYDASAVAITGGTINGTSIGATIRAAVNGTTINGNSTVTGTQLISSVSTGTSPLSVTSTTPVTNLSIGGNAATATIATTATTATNVSGGTISATTILASSTITPSPTFGIVGSNGTNDAQAGSVGEIITATGTGVSVSSGVVGVQTQVDLTAGDWDVQGNVTFISGAGCLPTEIASGIGVSNVSFPAAPNANGYAATFTVGKNLSCPCPYQRIKVTSTTTYYMVTYAVFSGGTMTATGNIVARRAR